MERPSGAKDAQDGAFGLVGGRFLGERLMARGIEGLAERGNLLETVPGKRGLELLDGHGESGRNGGSGLAFGRGGAEAERIQRGQEVLDDGGGGEAPKVRLVALVATGLVLLVGAGAEQGVLELGHLGLEGGEAGVGRGLGGGWGLGCGVGHGMQRN